MKTIYIISGPCGVGKSTITKALVKKLEHAVRIEGDNLLHMILEETSIPWEKQLSITWENLLLITRNFIEHDLDVVIDFVVEDELEWFQKNLADLPVKLVYVVLRADEHSLETRLHHRGDPDLIDRSKFLLKKLEDFPANKQHLYNTTNKEPKSIIKDLIDNIDSFEL